MPPTHPIALRTTGIVLFSADIIITAGITAGAISLRTERKK
jgi:hypothetical protein